MARKQNQPGFLKKAKSFAGASAAKAPESAPKPGSLTLLGAGSCKNSDGKSPPRYYFDGFTKGMAGCQDICASEPSCVGFEYSPTFNNGKCQFFASKKPASAANFAGPHGPNDKLDIAKADNSDPSRKFDCYRKVTAGESRLHTCHCTCLYTNIVCMFLPMSARVSIPMPAHMQPRLPSLLPSPAR